MEHEHYRDGLIGSVLDSRYEVLDRLGAGAMGLVYRARHVVLGSEVAIKVLRRSALSIPNVVQRAVREARAASAIGDPHIVEIRDFGVLPTGEPYMVMELLRGTELTALIANEAPLPIERVCRIGVQIAQALGAAHALGIVHRDLKSENVVLVPRPETPDFVKLVDFGIAHVQNAEAKITRAGELLGTPVYMAPEQCLGQPVDHRADIYALGVLLYEMLTGGPPFTARDPRALLVAHMTDTPTPPRQRRRDLTPALNALVMRCLAKNPDHRFASMHDVSDALDAVLRPPAPRRDVVTMSAAAPLKQPCSSRPSLRFAAGLVLGMMCALACLAGGAACVWSGPADAMANSAGQRTPPAGMLERLR